jgi:uroporphyrinogen-III decarboxylase
MSPEQFKTFYWPTLQKLIEGLTDEGLIPWLFFEGDHTSRLEIIRDMPKGKTICHFGLTDICQAKEVLGDVACIRGGIPNLLLCTGTTKEVKDYCKRLIDVAGEGGGFIMDTGAIIDEAKPENMKAMIDFTKEYGVYSQ